MIRPVTLRLPFPPMYFPMLNAVVNNKLIKNICPYIRLKVIQLWFSKIWFKSVSVEGIENLGGIWIWD